MKRLAQLEAVNRHQRICITELSAQIELEREMAAADHTTGGSPVTQTLPVNVLLEAELQ